MITEILNSNGKRALNSLEVTKPNQSSQQNGAKSLKLSNTEKSPKLEELKSVKDNIAEELKDSGAHEQKAIDQEEKEPQLEANINLR